VVPADALRLALGALGEEGGAAELLLQALVGVVDEQLFQRVALQDLESGAPCNVDFFKISLNKPHFIRCFIIHKLGKYPLTCDFYAKIEGKCDKIGQNIVQP
jgi:hypothetical protein